MQGSAFPIGQSSRVEGLKSRCAGSEWPDPPAIFLLRETAPGGLSSVDRSRGNRYDNTMSEKR